MTGTRLEIDAVSIGYGRSVVVDTISLMVHPGELVALLGPSGCGKTTLLRAVAGFLRPASGRIRFDGHVVDRLAPGQRRVGMVFQNYALFATMTVAENVAYGLEARRVPRREIGPRVATALEAVRAAVQAGPDEAYVGAEQAV